MPDKRDPLQKLRNDFALSRAGMLKIVEGLHREMVRGLSESGGELKMLPAYVDRPSGDETGEYLALDLGGTNFRALELGLKGAGRTTKPVVMKFAIKTSVMRGDGRKLFGFLASCIKRFLRAHDISPSGRISLGFTFSFAVEQDSLACGRLVGWTKGFSASGVVGRDVVKLLLDALRREGLGNIDVVALTNDTVGTLVAGAYRDSDCDIGVIIGTGTNACYTEKVSRIKKLGRKAYRNGRMIINIEWGNFSGLKRTIYDIALDRNSLNPGRQILEKMVSGMYLGELVRLVLADLAEMGAVFALAGPGAMPRYMGFGSELVSGIVADRSRGLSKTGRILAEAGIARSRPADRKIARSVCGMVSVRAARISAAAIAAVVTRMDPALSRRHVVAIDGSVYEKHPGFSAGVRSALGEIFGRRAARIKLVLTKDGSGKGAAIVAAVASGQG
jgi:hexokinase